MATGTGIGQQLKGMVRRARNYWSELTDEHGSQRQHREEEREDAVHQRYGGVRTQGERDLDTLQGDRSANDSSQASSDTQWANTSGRGAAGKGGQMQTESQTNRQYTQQGGSGIQKTLGEQLGGQAGTGGAAGSDPDTVRSRQSRRPGQQNH